MDLFVKSILQDSEEYKILKKTSSFKPQDKSFFLPIVKEVKRGKKVVIYQKKLSNNVFHEKKWNQKKEWNCWKQIASALHILHRNNILHFDVHLENIMVDKNKFYLIDFGISKILVPKQISKYHQLCLQWKEDEFQLLWNLIYRNNQYPSDFSTFRKVIQNESDNHKKILEKEICLLVPTIYAKKLLKLILSTAPIELTSVIEKTKCKMFLYRLFLIYHIFIYKPNPFYQKMIHSLYWKKF